MHTFAVIFIVLALLVTGWLLYRLGKAELHAAGLQRRLDRLLGQWLDTGAMTLDAYQELAMLTAKPQDPREAMTHALLGLASEVGELATHWKAHLYYGKPLDRDYMVKEAGDVLWFLQLAMTALSTTMEEVGQTNIKKLRLRYPDRYSDAAALARADEGRAT